MGAVLRGGLTGLTLALVGTGPSAIEQLSFWDVSNQCQPIRLTPAIAGGVLVPALAFRPDSRALALATSDDPNLTGWSCTT